MPGGRPRTAARPEGSVTRSYSLDRRAWERVEQYAKDRGVTRSQAASELILAGANEVGDPFPVKHPPY